MNIEVPENIALKVEGNVISISGEKGEIRKKIEHPKIELKAEGNKIIVNVKGAQDNKKTRALLGTIKSHVKNMIRGVQKGWDCKLKILYLHFPITMNVENDKVMIANFLGERAPRIAKIVGDTKVMVQGDEVIVSGINKEDVGHTAANIEMATKIKGYDRKVFQDGIFLIQKPR